MNADGFGAQLATSLYLHFRCNRPNVSYCPQNCKDFFLRIFDISTFYVPLGTVQSNTFEQRMLLYVIKIISLYYFNDALKPLPVILRGIGQSTFY